MNEAITKYRSDIIEMEEKMQGRRGGMVGRPTQASSTLEGRHVAGY